MNIRRFLTSLFILTSFIAAPLLVSPIALAEEFDPVKQSCDKIQVSEGFCTAPGGKDPFGPGGIFTNGTKVAAIVAGIAAVIVIIISAFRLIASHGDAQSISKAKSGLIYALIGLVVAGIAPSLISWVVNSVVK